MKTFIYFLFALIFGFGVFSFFLCVDSVIAGARLTSPDFTLLFGPDLGYWLWYAMTFNNVSSPWNWIFSSSCSVFSAIFYIRMTNIEFLRKEILLYQCTKGEILIIQSSILREITSKKLLLSLPEDIQQSDKALIEFSLSLLQADFDLKARIIKDFEDKIETRKKKLDLIPLKSILRMLFLCPVREISPYGRGYFSVSLLLDMEKSFDSLTQVK